MAFQQPSILNPSVPFSGSIYGGLSERKMVLIQGQVQPSVKTFAVNLRCGNGDIAFHFNPRFHESRLVVVCNTQQSQSWGVEERTYNMPFQPGTYFELIINIQGHCYQVSVNGKHFLQYEHRLPFHTVQTLDINGDVTVNCISFTNPSEPQVHAPPPYGFLASSQYTPVTVSNPVVPFQVAIPGNFSQPRQIIIVGNMPLHAKRFHVNLKNSLTGNIALHVNPRMDEKALVRNTQTHGVWGSEERHVSVLPFSLGQAFQMEITNARNCYQVSVNGKHAFDYVHRIPVNHVDQLEIGGDVTLSYVQY